MRSQAPKVITGRSVLAISSQYSSPHPCLFKIPFLLLLPVRWPVSRLKKLLCPSSVAYLLSVGWQSYDSRCGRSGMSLLLDYLISFYSFSICSTIRSLFHCSIMSELRIISHLIVVAEVSRLSTSLFYKKTLMNPVIQFRTNIISHGAINTWQYSYYCFMGSDAL